MSADDISPQVWGRATPAYDDLRFNRVVAACRSAEHLARAMAAERNRPPGWETRQSRIDTLQERLDEVTDT